MGSDYIYTFVYDNLNRLTNANSSIADNTESYSYNNDSSILTKIRNGNNLEYNYWENNNRLKNIIKILLIQPITLTTAKGIYTVGLAF
ncbi:MAG: hypothetical protein A2068_09340 [Ignavibacteria bacterium GWB2_35_6b]|nr:MAG: hypothetical protein A2068_09340 [Ignavibacteria bacterium GWB2_35_6b]